MATDYTVRIESFFEAAHNLRDYRGVSEPLHGHSYKVEADVTSIDPGLDEDAIAVDFVAAKRMLDELAKKLDYGYINEVPPFTEINPSAENIAAWFHRELSQALVSERGMVKAIVLWEGRFNSVTYAPK